MQTTTSNAAIGHVNLSVSNLERSLAFYQRFLQMKITKRIPDAAAFLSFGDYHHDLCINTWLSKGGEPRRSGTTGLYHFAVLYGELTNLQAVVRDLIAGGIEIDEVVDHAVTLSAYLRDPDGNGLELYWDRPRETWWASDEKLGMGHRPIALESLLAAIG
jgi:catechol 2,3-dioxygenase